MTPGSSNGRGRRLTNPLKFWWMYQRLRPRGRPPKSSLYWPTPRMKAATFAVRAVASVLPRCALAPGCTPPTSTTRMPNAGPVDRAQHVHLGALDVDDAEVETADPDLVENVREDLRQPRRSVDLQRAPSHHQAQDATVCCCARRHSRRAAARLWVAAAVVVRVARHELSSLRRTQEEARQKVCGRPRSATRGSADHTTTRAVCLRAISHDRPVLRAAAGGRRFRLRRRPRRRCCRRHPKLPACTKPRAGTAKPAALPSDDTIALARASCSADASQSYHAMTCLHDDCPPDPTAALQRARFPEEEATLAFDAARTPKAGLAYQTAGRRERLLRRIVATLYRHGVINASANIIEAGMAIGDNAVPWASMLSRLRPAGARGTVFAVDPMARNCDATRRLAQANRLANLCVLQRAIGDGLGFAAIKQRKGPKLQIPQISLDALDALPFGPASPALGFVHLDVEGLRTALRGAQRLMRVTGRSLSPSVTPATASTTACSSATATASPRCRRSAAPTCRAATGSGCPPSGGTRRCASSAPSSAGRSSPSTRRRWRRSSDSL